LNSLTIKRQLQQSTGKPQLADISSNQLIGNGNKLQSVTYGQQISLSVTVKIKFSIRGMGDLQQSSWYDASVTTVTASMPVAITTIATMLESQALLLTNSDNVGPDSGDRGLTTAVLGKTVSYRPTAKIILPVAINTIVTMLVSGSQMSLTNSGSKYRCRGHYKNVPGKTNNYTAKTILPVAINAIATLQKY